MLKNLTYQKKFLALLGISLLLLVLFWQGSISKSIDLVKMTNELEQKIQRDNIASSELARMKAQDKELSLYLGTADILNEDVKNNVLNAVLDYCENRKMEIIQMPESHIYEEEKHKIVTNRIKVKGAFIDLMKLNHHLEQEFADAKVSGINFELEKNKLNRKNELYAEIYLQNIAQLN